MRTRNGGSGIELEWEKEWGRNYRTMPLLNRLPRVRQMFRPAGPDRSRRHR